MIKRTMRICPSNKATRKLIAGAMLLVFALRALVPQGFMPASDRPFAVEICPEGFPAQMLMPAAMPMPAGMTMVGDLHHGGPHSRTEHCVFGTACASGPPSQIALLTEVAPTELDRAVPVVAVAASVRLVYLPHVRGPPAAA